MNRFRFLFAMLLVCMGKTQAASPSATSITIHVSPNGRDGNPGSPSRPKATLSAAQQAARAHAGKAAVTVVLHAGIYYLQDTLHFTSADSGTPQFPIVYTAAKGESPVISGGALMKLKWTKSEGGFLQAKTPPGMSIDQLFINGQRQHMARYPNYDPKAQQFNGSAADTISPERSKRWADPKGGYIHAMHTALWGDMHWRILGKKEDGTLDYEGGWQNNRPSPMHRQFRFVENIREELDAPGEWFHDAAAETLYLIPPSNTDINESRVEVVRLKHLIEFNGSKETPIKNIILRGLTFRHTARTFMENREPLLRSDWTVYRGGALVLNGTEDLTVEECDFDQLGGNTIFVNAYNRRTRVRGCLIRESGANGVAFVGDPKSVRSPLFNYNQKFDYGALDRTPGPATDNYPSECVVEDCLITRSGRFEKQTSPVQISMARNITVRNCSIYDVPRAGINVGDGCWGGHLIEGCDIFDTVLETGDHGSWNSWGRDRYWHPDVRTVDKQVALDPSLPFLDAREPNIIRNNRWRCDHGWDVDLDDGSSNFVISNNLFLHGGLKLREGYGRIVTNNIIVGNSFHPHVWFENSGDVFARNIVMGAYRPAIMTIAKWGKEVDWNLFTTSEADREKFRSKGCDANSLVGDPMFINPAAGDFRVKTGSPALKLGFSNFQMDNFGVQTARLRAIAKTPVIPSLKPNSSSGQKALPTEDWLGASLRHIAGEEFSAVGVAANTKGIFVAEAAYGQAVSAGLRAGDFIVSINDQPVETVQQFLQRIKSLGQRKSVTLQVVRSGLRKTVEIGTVQNTPDK